MVDSVTLPSAVGGDDTTITADAHPDTGIYNGGHLKWFIVALRNLVNIAFFVINTILGSADTNGTSTSSVAIGTGSKSFTTQTGKTLPVGSWVQIPSVASVANYMVGQVTAYNSGTGAITVNVLWAYGSGTFASWNIMRMSAPVPARAPVYTHVQMLALTPLAGDIVQVSDVGLNRTLWHHNGTAWKAAADHFVLEQIASDTASPVSSFTGSTAGFIPRYPAIKANLLQPGARILWSGVIEKANSGAGPTFTFYIGPNMSTGDAVVAVQAINIANAAQMRFHIEITIISSTLACVSGIIASSGGTMTPVQTQTRVISTAVINYLSIRLASGNAGDIHKLLVSNVEVLPC